MIDKCAIVPISACFYASIMGPLIHVASPPSSRYRASWIATGRIECSGLQWLRVPRFVRDFPRFGLTLGDDLTLSTQTTTCSLVEDGAMRNGWKSLLPPLLVLSGVGYLVRYHMIEDRLYWEFGGRITHRLITEGYLEWTHHLAGELKPLE